MKQYGDPIFNVRLPTWMIDELKRRAKMKGITMSELVRQIITDNLLIVDDDQHN